MYPREQACRIAEALIQSGEYPRAGGADALSRSFTIAISREAGSGGKFVAREVGRRLNWPVYDHELLDHLAQELHVDVDQLEGVDERRPNWLVDCVQAFSAASTVAETEYFHRLLKLLLTLGARGRCVILGRGAMIALPAETSLRVRVVASLRDRVAFIGRERGLNPTESARYVDSTDHERRRFIRDHFGKDASDPLLYDLILNASRFSTQECADLTIEGLQRLQARKAIERQKPGLSTGPEFDRQPDRVLAAAR
jgi:cytidylate kinase